MKLILNPSSVDDYRTFLRIKELPSYRIHGREVEFPDEYAKLLGRKASRGRSMNYVSPEWMFDYQRDITALALRKKKFAVFADCGLGKTQILLDFARNAVSKRRGILIVSPLNVVRQTVEESLKFFGEAPEIIRSSDVEQWMATCGGKIGITNYECFKHVDMKPGQLGGLILDESSMLKSHYGKYGTEIIKLGRGLEWKLCCTGTPAPNDRIEYANHAVFLDRFSTVNAFLATYFVNKGQTSERWILKPHALRPFYRSLSDWCIFLTNPATYGWKDNCENIPPIVTHIHHIDLTKEQRALMHSLTGELFANDLGGIRTRSQFGQIAKGHWKGQDIPTHKPDYIRELCNSFNGESAILWCIYNEEQSSLKSLFGDSACSISGSTKYEQRMEMIHAFQRGECKYMISKPSILGFGLNLQIATRQIFSGLQDSYESYYQAVKRSNRYGSTNPLHVHIPCTEMEEPMIQNVLRKADRVQADTEEQEQLFKECSLS